MTGPIRTDIGTPLSPSGPVASAVEQVTDGSVAAGGEVYGPPIPFETISALSDEELQTLADKYGIDTTTGLPKGLLVQEIHNRITGVVPVHPGAGPSETFTTSAEAASDAAPVTIEKVGHEGAKQA